MRATERKKKNYNGPQIGSNIQCLNIFTVCNTDTTNVPASLVGMMIIITFVACRHMKP